MTHLSIGVDGFSPARVIASDEPRWQSMSRRLAKARFLRSEGTVVTIGTPQQMDAALTATCRQVVSRFDRFYRAITSVDARAARAPESQRAGQGGAPAFHVNPLFEPVLRAEGACATPFPISRFDCVISPENAIKVIEFNPVGVCLLHVRSALYTQAVLRRHGWHEAADLYDAAVEPVAQVLWQAARGLPHLVDQLPDRQSDRQSDRQPEAQASADGHRPVVGMLAPHGWFRITKHLFAAAFRRHGFDVVTGSGRDLACGDEAVTLKGKAIDVLWADSLFFFGYQYERYKQTKFPSNLGGLRAALTETEPIVGNPRLQALVRDQKVAVVSPFAAYRGLSKELLAWISRPSSGLSLDGDTRAFLVRHVARTYGLEERENGAMAHSEALASKDGLVAKPCMFGGSHGVTLGRDVGPDEWARLLADIWTDEQWVLQEFIEPVKISDGDWLSVGLYNFAGTLGGVSLRTAPTLVVGARTSPYYQVFADAG